MRAAYVLRMKIDEEDRVPSAIEGKQALMGWPTNANLLEESLTREEIKSIIQSEYYSHEPSKRKAASASRNLWRFLRDMQVDDWIVVPWASKYFYLGQIAGPAVVDQFPNDDCFARAVRWVNPEEAFLRTDYPHIGRLLGSRTACYPIASAAGDIEQLAASFGWESSHGAGAVSEITEDIQEIYRTADLPETQRASLILARLGQGAFRTSVLRAWDNACAVTGCELTEVIRASHIKPWRSSNNAERLDPENGVPLVATLDALFDRGLITFNEDGAMLVCDEIADVERGRLGVPLSLRKTLSNRQKSYLEHHRENLYVGELSDGEAVVGVTARRPQAKG